MDENGEIKGHAFISYVREDAHEADLLQRRLEAAGLRVWRDTAHLWPGQDWRSEIQRAIRDDALVFLACFSHSSVSRGSSYQNEEIGLAVDQLRLRRPDVPWLIPVRFSNCKIPYRDIGGGRTLESLQRADLFGEHREEHADRLIATILGILGQSSGIARPDLLPEASQYETRVELALGTEVGRLFAGVWSGTAVITGGTVDARMPWLARIVALADSSASRVSGIASVADSAAPGIGTIDLVVNAQGRTVEEVRRRIAEGLGLPGEDVSELVDRLLHRQPPLAIVIGEVDSADRPGELIDELVAPLAAQARRRGIRLLLGFARRPPANLPYELSLGPEPISGTPRGAPDPDPGAVRQLIRELASAEDDLAMLYAHVSARVADVERPPPCLAPRLRVRYAVSVGEAATSELSLIRDLVEATLADIPRLRDRLEDLKREHEILGMTLDLWQQRAERFFGAEDSRLNPLFGKVYETLRSGPCDLAAARVALNRYIDAVNRHRSGETAQGSGQGR
jgi:TIR domain